MMPSTTYQRMIKKALSRFLLDDQTNDQVHDSIISVEWLIEQLVESLKVENE
ncbi:hypothetical protein KAR91_66130 [Candidatus Pacearchaeota archaeon]|nr:hypothetical protein [Candidatus Pacearchaeota archaeon]